MSVFSSVLNTEGISEQRGASWKDSSAWKRLLFLASRGAFPHSCAVVIDENLHMHAALGIVRVLLCSNGSGDDDCRVCSAWSGERHPDLLYCGAPSKPPSIDECREIIDAMAYRPVVSSKRVAVVFSADRMMLPAANSLLKLAEEPPEYVHMLFLLTDEKLFLPTLRSRSWSVSLPVPRSGESMPPPQTEEEWIRWIEKNAKSEVDELIVLFAPWISYEVERGAYDKAAALERIRLLIQTKRLSRTMVLDLIVLALKEGIVFEHSFGDLW
ncbi:MAG TPA: hypothetical protein PK849_05535 [Synergistales bacterium]|jgi:DNA polymerase-3 subunit delta'|nr:hypothetical protein [Synergistaceae bacterium]MDD3915722.1 hypothetical protein [Synergistaceae bacterium]HPE65622.1 hypothetical protein [Synergistales bacterium]HPR89843.1 hypothetical protein [Synergistaceae bacterium]